MDQQYSDYHLPMHAYPGIIYQPLPQPIPQPVASSSSAQYMSFNGDSSHHYAQQVSYGALPMQTITPQMLQGSSGNQMPDVHSFAAVQPSYPQNTFYANGAPSMHYGYTGVLPNGGPVAGPSSLTPESAPLLEQGKNGSDSGSSKDALGEKGGVGKWKNEKEKEKDKDKEGPVKNACLSCRTKKAKCDGARPVCGQCEKKNLECVFVKSRRGGARKKREVPPPTALQDFLKKLDTLMSIQESVPSPPVAEPNDDPTNVVRTFASRQEILKSYYEEVHPFLPVMPPKRHLEEVLPTLAAESPFILATKTILVLAPHPNDPAPKSSNSKRLRQLASNELSKQTMEAVSATLAEQSTIECVQALAMLSMWEWASAGSLSGNRARAGQAVQVAMEMGLHELDKHKAYTGVALEGEDWRKDMARRTWWTVYVAQLTASMVGGTNPVVGADDPRIMVDFPVCSLQDRAWPNWINTNRYCLRIFALINQAFYGQGAAAAWGSPGSADSPDASNEVIRRKILETDQQVMELMKQAEASAVIDLVPGGEEEVVRNQQLSTRLGLSVTHIHIHRQQAFPEVSLFSKRICGLPQAPDFITPNAEYDSLSAPNGTADKATVKIEGDHAFSLTEGYGDYQSRANGQSVPGSATLSGDTSGNASSVSLKHENSGDSLTKRSDAMLYTTDSGSSHGHGAAAVQNGGVSGLHPEYDFIDEMWQPETFPEMLPAPWFTHAGGAAALYAPIEAEPQHAPALTATIRAITPSDQGTAAGMASGNGHDRRGSMASMRSFAPSATGGVTRSTPVRTGPQKAWGVDAEGKAVAGPTGSADSGSMQVFPPGISLARCATAAHTIVRLEVLHRSAVIAMWNGPPKWLPFCACGLVTGAYAFLLLALAVQAENSFGIYDESKAEEIEALLTNVRVLLAGLEAYGVMWAGIETMAHEVRAALEAASRLPGEVRAQIHNASVSPPGQPYQADGSA